MTVSYGEAARRMRDLDCVGRMFIRRLERARAKHPEGTPITAILSEAGELLYALAFEPTWRAQEEAFDLAVTCVRWATRDGAE